MKIVFTGGGTGGHVTKNRILLEALREKRPDVERHYLGLAKGKEAELINAKLAQFSPISSGKLRRYASLQTIPDFFRVLRGIAQSYRLLGTIKPQLVFSSGGYVALPVAVAAKIRGIPVISHETDSYPGLANRMIAKTAEKILLGYDSAGAYFPAQKAHFVGNPVSPALFKGSRERALATLGFDSGKKTLLVMGGSQGAKQINELIWEILPRLIEEGWQVVHLTGKNKGQKLRGKGKLPKSHCERSVAISSSDLAITTPFDKLMTRNDSQYRPFEYISEGYEDLLASADLVISRAGGNSLAEIAALNKPAILIPLPLPAAAGDHQRKNAEEMAERRSDWTVLMDPNGVELLEAVKDQPVIPSLMTESEAAEAILAIILEYLEKSN